MRNTKLAFAERAQGFTEVDRTQGRETAMVVVGTLPLACSHLLPSAINALAETNPEVRVSVLDAPYDDLLPGLRIGDLDVRRCVEGSVAGRRRRPEAAVRRPVRRRRET